MTASSSRTTPPMPAVFIGHGNPMYAIEDNAYTAAWAELGRRLPRPKAILCVSAHWYTNGTAVTAMAHPTTIHDFGGFPQALFDMRYPAPGDPALAARVQALLAPLDVIADEVSWGLDHGAWAVLSRIYPDADIPVVQLSIDAHQPAAWHYALGQKLAALRDEGVLIVGSGNVVHNLRLVVWSEEAKPLAWAEGFNTRMREAMLAGDMQAVVDYEHDPDARLAVPTAEHFLPLLYVLGARVGTEPVSIPLDGIDMGSLSMMCVQVGA